jgi:hypothetical protein
VATGNLHSIKYKIAVDLRCRNHITVTDKPSVKWHVIDAVPFGPRKSPQTLPLSRRISILLRQSKQNLYVLNFGHGIRSLGGTQSTLLLLSMLQELHKTCPFEGDPSPPFDFGVM